MVTQPPSESSNSSASSSLIPVWVIIAILVAAIALFGVVMYRKRRSGRQYRVAVAGNAAPIVIEDDLPRKKLAPIDWEGIDESEDVATSAGIPFTGGRAEVLPIAAHEQAKPDLESQLRDVQDFIVENEYKPGVYRIQFENAPKRKQNGTFHAAQNELNLHKNRYRDILPYDDTRVCLIGNEDYINANHISLRVAKQQFWYIATQGPLSTTLSDFWQMVWQNQAHVIAMVSAEFEKGVLKVNAYWPTQEGDEGTMTYGKIQVTLSRSVANDAYVIRGLRVKNTETGETRAIWQLQYVGWPDHGVPDDPRYFLAFLDEIHNIRQRVCAGNTAVFPTVVHCSAGIGRSGVLILVEIALARVAAGLKPNIGDILNEVREQRPSMVQTIEQYKFCFEAVIAAMQQKVQESNTRV
jgi:protein tyrosine phosphatase